MVVSNGKLMLLDYSPRLKSIFHAVKIKIFQINFHLPSDVILLAERFSVVRAVNPASLCSRATLFLERSNLSRQEHSLIHPRSCISENFEMIKGIIHLSYFN